ncbi:hypothetical protein MSG28_012319 [Choristoneura fumiferana]|uniref:Uncharacterized protein n=1 Tax=Choristoneura fumiferana TaxID=7141 RepID=A0ACC0KCY1_CHOFU|nr:hypothetical protein MSG28_012319 [Choristoneura fumiferana]
MPLVDITNPKIIRFLLESYEKEARLRMKWSDKYAKGSQIASFRGEPKNYVHADIEYAVDAAGMAATTRDHLVAARHRYAKPIKDNDLLKLGKAKEPQPIMYPVDKKLIELRKQDGAESYLKKRTKLSPEDKYIFAETTSFMYGWRLKDSEMKVTGPKHPRVCQMQRTMFTTVGLNLILSITSLRSNQLRFVKRKSNNELQRVLTIIFMIGLFRDTLFLIM